MPNEIPVVFHNSASYYYHFIIKELANKFEGEFECIGENKSIKRFLLQYLSSLSNLVDNQSQGIHEIKCKDCGCFLEYKPVEVNLIIYECLSCNEFYSKNLNEKLKKKFNNTIKFSNNDIIIKFILLLRKGVYPCEHVDDWEKFNETKLPEK